MILCADIGGTKSLFALVEFQDSPALRIIHEISYPSIGITSLEARVEHFLHEVSVPQDRVESACFSLAGPIQHGRCRLSNLDLTVELEKLKNRLSGIPRVKICNDLEATAHGLFLLPEQDLLCLTPDIRFGFAQEASFLNRAIIAPGTGLGESLIMDGKYVFPTEGAHTEFGPQTEEEVRLWRFLHRIFGHVSYDRILSGSGLLLLYQFLQGEYPGHVAAPHLEPHQISEKAMADSCSLCRHALDLFVRILGAEAGNLALKSLALGGIYLGGGIPPKILPKLQDGVFLSSFCNKGRFSELMGKIPVYVILNDRTALYGAALLALPPR